MTSSKLTNAVVVSDGKVTTTSLKIAEVFGKLHKDVLKAIESLQVPDGFRERNFSLSEYSSQNGLGKTINYKMYLITRDGFTLLAMGFTGFKAMQFKIAYIEAFNAMEAKLREQQAVPVQPELPLEGWKIRNGQRVIPLSKVAKKMNLRYSQAYGLCYRHKKEFRAGTDIVRFGDSLYLTEPGAERMAELAKRVDFHEFRATHRRALPSVPRRDPDIVGIQFQEQGYTEAFYLTYQMLLNWYSLNEDQMRTAVSDLERLSGAETKELPSVAGATQTFCAVSSFSAVVDHMKKHLFNMVKSNLENEKQTIILRLPQILVDDIMQKKAKPPLDGFCQTELAYPTK